MAFPRLPATSPTSLTGSLVWWYLPYHTSATTVPLNPFAPQKSTTSRAVQTMSALFAGPQSVQKWIEPAVLERLRRRSSRRDDGGLQFPNDQPHLAQFLMHSVCRTTTDGSEDEAEEERDLDVWVLSDGHTSVGAVIVPDPGGTPCPGVGCVVRVPAGWTVSVMGDSVMLKLPAAPMVLGGTGLAVIGTAVTDVHQRLEVRRYLQSVGWDWDVIQQRLTETQTMIETREKSNTRRAARKPPPNAAKASTEDSSSTPNKVPLGNTAALLGLTDNNDQEKSTGDPEVAHLSSQASSDALHSLFGRVLEAAAKDKEEEEEALKLASQQQHSQRQLVEQSPAKSSQSSQPDYSIAQALVVDEDDKSEDEKNDEDVEPLKKAFQPKANDDRNNEEEEEKEEEEDLLETQPAPMPLPLKVSTAAEEEIDNDKSGVDETPATQPAPVNFAPAAERAGAGLEDDNFATQPPPIPEPDDPLVKAAARVQSVGVLEDIALSGDEDQPEFLTQVMDAGLPVEKVQEGQVAQGMVATTNAPADELADPELKTQPLPVDATAKTPRARKRRAMDSSNRRGSTGDLPDSASRPNRLVSPRRASLGSRLESVSDLNLDATLGALPAKNPKKRTWENVKGSYVEDLLASCVLYPAVPKTDEAKGWAGMALLEALMPDKPSAH